MDKETLRRVQLTQLEIAKEIKRVCEDCGIEYWLDSGTLLGAVRHKGFIPWDDDLDIGMKRDDYERFLELAPQRLNPQFHLQQWETDPGYGLCFAKIRKAGTVYIENKTQRSSAENGIFVDIFPYDHFGNDPKGQGWPIKIIKTMMMVKSGINTWIEEDSINYKRLMKNIPPMMISPFFSRKKLIQKYTALATQYNTQPAEFYFPQGISNYGRWLIPVSAVEEVMDAPFEDATFRIPKGYDAYLTHAYGDYMKLPPEEQRENRHQILEVKF